MPTPLNSVLLSRFEQKEKGLLKRRTLLKRIERRATADGISTQAALIVLAKEAGIGIARVLNNESAEVKNEVRAALSKSHPPRERRKRIQSEQMVALRVEDQNLSDPLLPQVTIRNARQMSVEVYPLLYVFENSIREFIQRVKVRDHGDAWWDEVMSKTKKLSEIRRKAADRMRAEQQLTWHAKRGAHPIYYTDFDDLITILKTNAGEFRPFFRGISKGANWLIDKMEEIYPSRNVTAHHNPLSKRDHDRLRVNVQDWESHLSSIVDQL